MCKGLTLGGACYCIRQQVDDEPTPEADEDEMNVHAQRTGKTGKTTTAACFKVISVYRQQTSGGMYCFLSL